MQAEHPQLIDDLAMISVTVHDQDEALDWYTAKLGFEKRSDQTTTEFGPEVRHVTAAPREQGTEIVLWKPNPELNGEERTEQLIDNIGNQDIGTFETSDIDAAYEAMRSRGVTFLREPTEQSYGKETAFEDLYGNTAWLWEQA